MKQRNLFLLCIIILIGACKKENNTTTTPQVKTQEELLTQHTWKADEIRVQLSNNTTGYYKRGGGSNTINYDSDSIKFSTNNIGVYYYLGIQYTTTWNFTNTEKTKMTIVINYPSPITLYLEYIKLADTYFTYTQFSSAGGISYLASGTRIPN